MRPEPAYRLSDGIHIRPLATSVFLVLPDTRTGCDLLADRPEPAPARRHPRPVAPARAGLVRSGPEIELPQMAALCGTGWAGPAELDWQWGRLAVRTAVMRPSRQQKCRG